MLLTKIIFRIPNFSYDSKISFLPSSTTWISIRQQLFCNLRYLIFLSLKPLNKVFYEHQETNLDPPTSSELKINSDKYYLSTVCFPIARFYWGEELSLSPLPGMVSFICKTMHLKKYAPKKKCFLSKRS